MCNKLPQYILCIEDTQKSTMSIVASIFRATLRMIWNMNSPDMAEHRAGGN